MKKDRHLLSYLAGIFDGEGCVSICKTPAKKEGGKSPQYRLSLSVGMTDKEIPMLFSNLFGGCLYKKKKCPPNRKQAWVWTIHGGKQCLSMLQDLLPYCIVKAPQMKVAIHFINLRRQKGKRIRLTEGELALREVDRILCGSLKRIECT